MLMTLPRNKHKDDYRFIDACFQKKSYQQQFIKQTEEISIQTNKDFLIQMTPSHNTHQHNYRRIDSCFQKTLRFMPVTVFPVNRNVQHQHKPKFVVFVTSSRKKHHHDYRLIDGCLHKKLESHVSCILSNKQKKSSFKHSKNVLF